MPHESTVNPNDVSVEDPGFCRRISRVPGLANFHPEFPSPKPQDKMFDSAEPLTPCLESAGKYLAFCVSNTTETTPKLNNNSRPQTPNVLNHDFDDESEDEAETI